MSIPTNTPNVVIENPTARRVARTVLDIFGLALGTLIVVDGQSDAFSLTAYTAPAAVGWMYLRSGFGLGVDNPNTPKPGVVAQGDEEAAG